MATPQQQPSPYYPTGWDRERMMNVEDEEIETLSIE